MLNKLFLVVLVLFAAACGDPAESSSTDAGTGEPDASANVDQQDAGTDAGSVEMPTCQSPEQMCGEECIDTTSNLAHCGACGQACAELGTATSTCTASACAYTCDDGRFDLDDDLGEADGNGCEATCMPTGEEICDDVDNNCDGTVDEGCDCVSGTSRDCGLAVGVCEMGRQMCRGNGTWGACNGGVGPTDEVCDGLDNNCDGSIDESPVDANQDCDTGQPGACQVGTSSCNAGTLLCNLTTLPSNEICNGIDDNCNGSIDEGDPEAGAACTSAEQGICEAGTTSCNAGSLDCVPNESPVAELCDGLDNDCDGDVDEGDPESGMSCDTGLLGICAFGTSICSMNSLSCIANDSPQTETCDGLDNDCDGTVDEGCPDSVILANLSNQTEFGNASGQGFTNICSSGSDVLVGVIGKTSGRVRSVGGRCQSLGIDVTTTSLPYTFEMLTTGPVTQLREIGATTGSIKTAQCPAGEYVVGIYGYADASSVTQLGVRCGVLEVDDTTFAITPGITTDVLLGGMNTGTAFSQDCPAGMVATGTFGHSLPDQINAIGLRCADANIVFK